MLDYFEHFDLHCSTKIISIIALLRYIRNKFFDYSTKLFLHHLTFSISLTSHIFLQTKHIVSVCNCAWETIKRQARFIQIRLVWKIKKDLFFQYFPTGCCAVFCYRLRFFYLCNFYTTAYSRQTITTPGKIIMLEKTHIATRS